MSNKDWKPPHVNQDDCEHNSTYATTCGSMRSYETFTHEGAFCAKCGKDMRGPPLTAKDYGASFTVDKKAITRKKTVLQLAMEKAARHMRDKFHEKFKAEYLNEPVPDKKKEGVIVGDYKDEGQVCGVNGCKGTIQHDRPVDGGCACHVNPPCGWCTTTVMTCDECDYEDEHNA